MNILQNHMDTSSDLNTTRNSTLTAENTRIVESLKLRNKG